MEPSAERLLKDAERVLKHSFWPPGLETNVGYSRLHDDHDGTQLGRVIVTIGDDGDVWVRTDQHEGPTLRFRTGGCIGGGRSPRVRNALMLLALAIKLDAEDALDGSPSPAA